MDIDTSEYNIDLTELHNFERQHYNDHPFELSEEMVHQIIERLKDVCISDTEPFVTRSENESYYLSTEQTFLSYFREENPFMNDMARVGSKFYTFLRLENATIYTEHFHLWFVLMLRHYTLDLWKVDEYLDHHLVHTFEGDKTKMKKFLKIALRTYEDEILPQKISSTVYDWMEEKGMEQSITKQSVGNVKESIQSHTKPARIVVRSETEIIPKRNVAPRTIEGEYLSFKLSESCQKFSISNDKRSNFWINLRDDLMKSKFVSAETNAGHLKNIFLNINIPKDERITWVGANRELRLFIMCLHNEMGIVEDTKKEKWYLTTKCFVDKHGQDYEISSLSNASGKNLKRDTLLRDILNNHFNKD